jgi:hypothetical protein
MSQGSPQAPPEDNAGQYSGSRDHRGGYHIYEILGKSLIRDLHGMIDRYIADGMAVARSV